MVTGIRRGSVVELYTGSDCNSHSKIQPEVVGFLLGSLGALRFPAQKNETQHNRKMKVRYGRIEFIPQTTECSK